MLSTPLTENDDADKNMINIDFGIVPVGSTHKKSIDITNNLRASFFLLFIDVYF